ncbi:MAG: hypothetical protein Q9162_000587 [Coniocarpon cinnabarinum]
MAVPHQLFLAVSVSTTWILVHHAPHFMLLESIWLTALAIQAFLTCCTLTWSVILYPHCFSPLRKLPQPPGGSFLNGHFWRIFSEPSGVPQSEWIESVPNDGLIYYRSIMNSERVFVTSIDAMKEVLTAKSYEYVKPRQFLEGVGRILGVGVLFAEGDEHKRQRKALMPAFSFRHIKELYPLFWEKTRELVLALDHDLTLPKGSEEKPSRVIVTQEWASRSTLDIIGEAGMGKSFNAIQDEHSELYQLYQTLFQPSRVARFMQFLGLVLPFKLVSNIPVKRNQQFKDACKFLREMCRSMIREKHERMAQGKQVGVDILSIAIESGGFTDENLVDQMMTFLAAGHETTATSLTWAVCLLCQHPTVQKRLRDELKEAQLPNIRDQDATVTSEIIDKIPYLNAVCNEVLRFSAPVPFTFRQTSQDEWLMGQFIPKKTAVVLAPMAVNRSPSFWGPDANEFNPDRWMGAGRANTGGAESNYAFMTFLHGPRSCIGQQFSKAEFACLLAGWVQAFEFELKDPDMKIEIQGGITARPKGGLPVVLTRISP